MNDETLKEQIENCFIINNMCDCVDEHTSLNLDDTEYFDVERVVSRCEDKYRLRL